MITPHPRNSGKKRDMACLGSFYFYIESESGSRQFDNDNKYSKCTGSFGVSNEISHEILSRSQFSYSIPIS